MEKNQTSHPKAVCEKIFRAITFGPAFASIRRISSRQQAPSPGKYAPNSTKLTSPQRPKQPASNEGSEVPVEFDYTAPTDQKLKPTALNGSTQNNIIGQSRKPIVSGNGQEAQNKSKPMAENGQMEVKMKEAKKATQRYDDKFSNYIDETKKKIMSHDQGSAENSAKLVGKSHGHGHGGVGKDHHFSDYIDQTKRKIRTTSSLKDRSDSFFKRLTFQ